MQEKRLFKRQFLGNGGSMFVLTIWTVFMLSFFAFYAGRFAFSRIEFVKQIEQRDAAKNAALSGVYEAINAVMKEEKKGEGLFFYKVLRTKIGDVGGPGEKGNDIIFKLGYNYITDISFSRAYTLVTDEESKLNLNTIEAEVLAKLISNRTGMEHEKALSMAFDIIDWRDADNERPALSIINNEDKYYELSGMPYVPKNSDYEYVEELLLVKDMTYDIYKAITPDITVYGSGRVNINTCPVEVLGALGLDPKVIAKIIDRRSGKKQLKKGPETLFRSVDNIIADIESESSLTEDEKKSIESLVRNGAIGVTSEYFKIETLGEYRERRMLIDAVVYKSGATLAWKERYIK